MWELLHFSWNRVNYFDGEYCRYLDTVEDVMDFCASVHNREDKVGRPNLIIVDDIGSYIEQLQVNMHILG